MLALRPIGAVAWESPFQLIMTPGGRANVFFFFVFVIVHVNDNVDDRASCLVPQRFRRVASVDVDAALPRGPTLIRDFFFSPWPARTPTTTL